MDSSYQETNPENMLPFEEIKSSGSKKASIIISDEYVNEIFGGSNFGEEINNCVNAKRKQLHKTLTALVKGKWSGHAAYHIVLEGGFIKDGKGGNPKTLTALGNAFMRQYSNLLSGK